MRSANEKFAEESNEYHCIVLHFSHWLMATQEFDGAGAWRIVRTISTINDEEKKQKKTNKTTAITTITTITASNAVASCGSLIDVSMNIL